MDGGSVSGFGEGVRDVGSQLVGRGRGEQVWGSSLLTMLVSMLSPRRVQQRERYRMKVFKVLSALLVRIVVPSADLDSIRILY